MATISGSIKQLLIGGNESANNHGQGHGALYQDLHNAIQERNISYSGGGGGAAARIYESKKHQNTRDSLKKATKVLMEMTRKQEDALKRHIQKAADPNEFRGFIYPYQLIPEEEYRKINDTINEYYKLKDKYDTALKKRRRRIIEDPAIIWDTLSAQQKAKRLSIIRPACILCKQDGGTIFSEKGGRLKAICGNMSQPCGLHVEVERGKYESLEKLMNESLEEVRATKDEIIRLKLDLLFQFITEEEVSSLFDGIQHKLQEQLKMYAEFRTYYLSVIENQDIRHDVDNLTRIIGEKVVEIKNYIKEFADTEWKNKSLIDDILVIYQDHIEPAYMKIRENKYVYSQIETGENANGSLIEMYEGGEFYLSQKTYSFHELYMPVVMPKWISDHRMISKPVGSVKPPAASAASAASAAPKRVALPSAQLIDMNEMPID
jgi:hypothetical protein